MLGSKPELAEASLQAAVHKKQEIDDLKLIIEILKLFEVFSDLISLEKSHNHIVSQLYIIRTELKEIQQKHFMNTLVQEVVDCLLLSLGERFKEWGTVVGPQGTGCSEFAIAHFLDPHVKGLELWEQKNLQSS